MARRSNLHLTRGPGRKTIWANLTTTDTTMTATGGTIIFNLSAGGLLLRPFTIVRTYLQGSLFSDQAAAIETQACALGVAVVSEQASAIGVTAVPTPETDAESDLWLLHQRIFADESNLTDRIRPSTKFSFDSKAMRKVQDGEQMIVVAENIAAVSFGLILRLAGRMLLKLH